MRIQGVDGVTAKFITWNLSCTDQSFVVVALDDGSLQEWGLKGCRIVEERKTSDALELAATDNQHTQGKIGDVLPRCKVIITAPPGSGNYRCCPPPTSPDA